MRFSGHFYRYLKCRSVLKRADLENEFVCSGAPHTLSLLEENFTWRLKIIFFFFCQLAPNTVWSVSWGCEDDSLQSLGLGASLETGLQTQNIFCSFVFHVVNTFSSYPREISLPVYKTHCWFLWTSFIYILTNPL